MPRPTAIVYVDGFNLYRRALVETPYKWLDLEALFSHTLQEFEVVKIKYFTARIQPKPHEKSQHIRQNIYLRALQIGLILTSKEPAVELMGIGLPILRQIREGTLSISQLPDELSDAVGRIRAVITS